ncbi:MAG TPA: inositol monophosphatase family protein [Candidatus Polarisedimenticolia bacterium]|nr:inositol monophosphatase family protein [Candidatus Polarisedimenticolia bacterium]
MARRRRGDTEVAARRKGRTRRSRPPADWPAGGGPNRRRGASPVTGRVVTLTPALRRAATRRRRQKRARITAAVPAPVQRPAADFHLAACVACARIGGRVIMDYWGRRGSFKVQEKGRRDYVTIVDREAEAAIVRLVRERFPDHAILAEESAPTEGTVGYRWYIDPLDGTTNYIHGYPLFAVSIAVSDPQGMRAAAVYDPVRNEMFTAARGAGAFLNGEPLRVSSVETLAQSLLVTGIPFRSLGRLDEYIASFRAFVLGAGGIRRDGSAALDLAYVAAGRLDGFWEMSLSPWDVAAGSLIVREAGGIVTDFQGRAGYLESGDIIAANPKIQADMLRIVRECYRRA